MFSAFVVKFINVSKTCRYNIHPADTYTQSPGVKIVVVRGLPEVQSDYQLGDNGGPTDYHKIQEYFHIYKSIFDNGPPDISEDC